MADTQVIDRKDVDIRTTPLWNVVLLDDDDHTYEYVIDLLSRVFGYRETVGFRMACEVDNTGRVICATLPLEHAEVKRDQIHAFGPDHRMNACKGSMSAVLEPAC